MTIIEAVLASLVVGTAVMAAMNVVGFTAAAHTTAMRQTTARMLAMALLNDITCLPYEDPDVPTAALGRESGEPNVKTAFDDVDDYHNWNESPPTDRTGAPIPGASGWQRSVVVEWVRPLNLDQASTTETPIKRITVTAKHKNLTLTRSAIRTKH